MIHLTRSWYTLRVNDLPRAFPRITRIPYDSVLRINTRLCLHRAFVFVSPSDRAFVFVSLRLRHSCLSLAHCKSSQSKLGSFKLGGFSRTRKNWFFRKELLARDSAYSKAFSREKKECDYSAQRFEQRGRTGGCVEQDSRLFSPPNGTFFRVFLLRTGKIRKRETSFEGPYCDWYTFACVLHI